MMSQATVLAEPSDIILHEHIPADKILSEAEVALLRRELAGRLDVVRQLVTLREDLTVPTDTRV